MNYIEEIKALHAEASRLLALGYSIIPAVPSDKRPAVDWDFYYENPATQLNIDEWWDVSNSDIQPYNIAIITGKDHNIVLDFDPNEGVPIEELVNEAQLHFGEYFPDETGIVSTAGGGYHYHFHCNRVVKSRIFFKGKKGKIELRAEKSIAIMPPSRAHSKRTGCIGDYSYIVDVEANMNWMDTWMSMQQPWNAKEDPKTDFIPNEPYMHTCPLMHKWRLPEK